MIYVIALFYFLFLILMSRYISKKLVKKSNVLPFRTYHRVDYLRKKRDKLKKGDKK